MLLYTLLKLLKLAFSHGIYSLQMLNMVDLCRCSHR